MTEYRHAGPAPAAPQLTAGRRWFIMELPQSPVWRVTWRPAMAPKQPTPAPPAGTPASIDKIKAERDVYLGSQVTNNYAPPAPPRDHNGRVMLKRVRETWITGLLEHSLEKATRL